MSSVCSIYDAINSYMRAATIRPGSLAAASVLLRKPIFLFSTFLRGFHSLTNATSASAAVSRYPPAKQLNSIAISEIRERDNVYLRRSTANQISTILYTSMIKSTQSSVLRGKSQHYIVDSDLTWNRVTGSGWLMCTTRLREGRTRKSHSVGSIQPIRHSPLQWTPSVEKRL